MLLVQNLQSIYLLCRNMIHLRSYLKKFIFSLKLFPDYVSIRTKLCLFSLIFSFLMAPIMHATQRDAMQFTRLNFCPHFQKSSFSSGFPIFLHFHQNQFLFCFIVPLRFLPEVFPPLIYERGTIALVPKRRVNEKGCPQ